MDELDSTLYRRTGVLVPVLGSVTKPKRGNDARLAASGEFESTTPIDQLPRLEKGGVEKKESPDSSSSLELLLVKPSIYFIL